jgi:uncharacterized protein YecE (DUF72 family)
MMKVLIGCCGFPLSRKRYYSLFDSVELQDTFYNPPDSGRLSKLRDEAPEGFTFTMKAWQAITHPPSMRTWRRSKISIPKELWVRYGFLRPTEENFRAWEQIVKGAKALKALVVVVQLPPSFNFSEEHLRNVREFFTSVERPSFYVGLEVRGDWRQHPEELREVIEDVDFLIHVTDPFKWMPVSLKKVAYFRLHGIGGNEVNYKYRYTDDDLLQLKKIVSTLEHAELVFIMFNNVYMRDDALRFKELIKGNSLS